MNLQTVEAAYRLATQQFRGADWVHVYRSGEAENYQDVDGDEPEPIYCTGQANCETCSEAHGAAEESEREAKAALEHARAGRWVEAERCMDRIVGPLGYEGQFGAAPTWQPMAEAVRAAARAAWTVE